MESGILFDAATRRLTAATDTLGVTREPSFFKQRLHTNMQDIRNKLDVKSLRWKIDKRVLQRIGHVLRKENDGPTKAAVYFRVINRP